MAARNSKQPRSEVFNLYSLIERAKANGQLDPHAVSDPGDRDEGIFFAYKYDHRFYAGGQGE